MFRTILQPSRRIPCLSIARTPYLRSISSSLPVLAAKNTKDQRKSPAKKVQAKKAQTEKKEPQASKVFRTAPKLDLTQRQIDSDKKRSRKEKLAAEIERFRAAEKARVASQTAEHLRIANVVAERDKKKAKEEDPDGGVKFDPEQPILLVDTDKSFTEPITYHDLVKEIGPQQVADLLESGELPTEEVFRLLNEQEAAETTEVEEEEEEQSLEEWLAANSPKARNSNGAPYQMDELYAFLQEEGVEDLAFLDCRDKTSFCDYSIVGTCKTHAHQFGVAKALLQKSVNESRPKLRFEGKPADDWLCFTSDRVIVHFMNRKSRPKWELDKLWALRVTQDHSRALHDDVELLPETFCHYPPEED